jgi:hypothetical protein
MGIFDIFKKKQNLVDDIFGKLRYSTFSDKSKNFYDGTVMFDRKEIGITIDADENGPTKTQKQFYSKLLNDYSVMKIEIIIPHLKNELKDWDVENEIIDFDKEFAIDGISLTRITDKSVCWSLTLYSTKISHYLTIEFINQEPQKGIMVDG